MDNSNGCPGCPWGNKHLGNGFGKRRRYCARCRKAHQDNQHPQHPQHPQHARPKKSTQRVPVTESGAIRARTKQLPLGPRTGPPPPPLQATAVYSGLQPGLQVRETAKAFYAAVLADQPDAGVAATARC